MEVCIYIYTVYVSYDRERKKIKTKITHVYNTTKYQNKNLHKK